ncbi:MAG: transglutaminase-like cysteine peptidase [Deltaproteobacteria bacterium]|nr:transglutaminase-like cysteine peptidase [Deltaproteobacteria bacterium]
MKRVLLFALCCVLLCAATGRAATGVFRQTERTATVRDPWHRKIQPLWQRVLEAEKRTPGFTREGDSFGPVDHDTWKNLVAYAKGKPETEVLRAVNGYFNQWLPKNDQDTWNSPEYWASPREFIRQRGGDCEDYAIAKYFALRFLGIGADRMRLVVVRRKDENGALQAQLHAVLAVRANNGWFILDNNARPGNNIFPDTQYRGRFDPLYSVNENGAWVHGSQAAARP